jgi:hypothetical protein
VSRQDRAIAGTLRLEDEAVRYAIGRREVRLSTLSAMLSREVQSDIKVEEFLGEGREDQRLYEALFIAVSAPPIASNMFRP